MLNKIKEGCILEVLFIQEEKNIIGCLINIEQVSITIIPSELISFLEEYEYIYSYINKGYHLLFYIEENNYKAKMIIDKNKNPDRGKRDLVTIAQAEHPILSYALYMLNDDLKRREKVKKTLTLIKGGKKWKVVLSV